MCSEKNNRKRSGTRERERERERKDSEEMEKGMLAGVGYVLSACVPLYSNYCITGLALLPPIAVSAYLAGRPPHHPHPISIAASRGRISQCTPSQNA